MRTVFSVRLASSFFVVAMSLLVSIVPSAEAQTFPNAPTSVQASDGTSNSNVQIGWSAPVGGAAVASYKVYRATTNLFCAGSVVGTVTAPTTSFTDTSATPSTIYYYSVRAVGVAPDNFESNCSNTDSGFRSVAPPPLPPTNLSATNNLLDKIALTWQLPTSGEQVTGIQIFRATTQSVCAGSPIASLNTAGTAYNDTEALAGQVYYYSLKSTGPTGPSACSAVPVQGFRLEPPPPLPPASVSATDGTFTNKVNVSWIAPTGSTAITNYRLHRSTVPALCNSLLIDGIAAGSSNIDDTNVEPGRLYYYSMDSVGPNGLSTCSAFDPGYARISPPENVSGTDGTFPDKVVVTWTPPSLGGAISGYELYKSTVPGACTSLLAGNLTASTLSFTDSAVTVGTLYYYSLMTLSPTGKSVCSAIDSGFAAPIPLCRDGLDNDGDGLTDLNDPGCKNDPNRNTEKDPTGPVCDNGLDDDGDGFTDYRVDENGDPGCLSPTDDSEDDSDAPLKSPAYIKFNTYLGQWNYAELINQGTKDKQVDVTIFNLYGQAMITRTFVVPPKNEVDVDVNSLIMFACDVLKSNCSSFEDLSKTAGAQNGLGRPDGVVDTYGLVELKFDDSDPDERLLGRMSFYRPSPDGQTFSFAFAREFKNPLKGTSAATANTYDPQGFGNLVPNWAEVINLSSTPQTYTVNIFTQEGVLRQTRTLTLAALGEFDVQAGHEFIGSNGKAQEAVYLVEVIPVDPNAPYSFSVSRYSSTAQGGGLFDPSNYNFAFSIEASGGSAETLYVPISNQFENVSGLASTVSMTNWVEVVNTGSKTANFHINFRGANGSIVASTNAQAAPKSQLHFNASALLPVKSSGSAEIVSDVPLVVQSLSYVHGSKNELQSGFVIPARNAGRAQQAGSINTFLNMQNVFGLISTSPAVSSADFTIASFSGGTYQGSVDLAGSGASSLGLSNNPVLNLPSNTYGAVVVDTGAEGVGLAEIRRVRIVNGAIDFVMPTALK